MKPKIYPVDEMLPEEEFTDRVEILRQLEEWYRNIKRLISSSLAIISPRRMGKTVVLDRLVNTVFFKDYGVAPFYFKMKREETTLRKFLLEYYTTFFRQYIAYILKDPLLYKRNDVSLEKLLSLKSDDERVQFVQREYISEFLKRYEKDDWRDARNHWEDMIKTPEILSSLLGTHVAVIIDEFQDMKFYIYDIDVIPEDPGKKPMATDLTATYDRQSQSRYAPMLVSGSAVTTIFHAVMGGPLSGRFGFEYLKPLAIEDGATLIKKLLQSRGTSIPDALAVYLSSRVSGHPYYIYCCAESKCPEKSFDSEEGIDKVIDFEVTRGKIFGFWETHFAQNRENINQDNDIELGKKIIYYFTKYNNAAVDIDEIARKLGVSKYAVEEKIERLYWADLVYRSDYRYYTFNDPMLMRYIQNRYEKEVKDVEKIDLQEQGRYNYIKGKFLEMVVQNLMGRFNGEQLDGGLFGLPGKKVRAPRFIRHGERIVKLPDSSQYQIDAYGEYTREGVKSLWVVECKYRKSDDPMTSAEVEKVLRAAEVLKEEKGSEEVTLWLISTGGFTGEALEVIKRHGCLHSGQDEINAIVRRYGIEVKVMPME